jgi:hypothetical protein
MRPSGKKAIYLSAYGPGLSEGEKKIFLYVANPWRLVIPEALNI